MTKSSPEIKLPSSETIFGISQRSVFRILLGILVIPFIVFISLSTIELYKQTEAVNNYPKINNEALISNEGPIGQNLINALVLLEKNVVAKRAHRLQSYNTTRTWLRYMSVILGAIMILVGAGFVLGKVTADESDMKASLGDHFKLSLITTSPGLLIILLGVILIVFRAGNDDPIENKAQAMYIDMQSASSYLRQGANITRHPLPTKEEADALNDPNIQSALDNYEYEVPEE